MKRKTVVQFGKAQVAALLSSLADFVCTAVTFGIVGTVAVSTLFGAMMGGIINCIINYCWTFSDSKGAKGRVAMRYLLVWIGSMTLNVNATVVVVKFFEIWFPTSVSTVTIARILVALLVAIAWNFPLQKFFVYRNSKKS